MSAPNRPAGCFCHPRATDPCRLCRERGEFEPNPHATMDGGVA
jgi:hypothetical protein